MAITYSHTASMVLATSVTTAVSFVGTSISPIFSIASLGIYAALCILMNWLLTTTISAHEKRATLDGDQSQFWTPGIGLGAGSIQIFCREA